MKRTFAKSSVIFAMAVLFLLLPCLIGCGENTGTSDFDERALFKFGLVPVMKDDKWGYMDSDCNIVIPLRYDKASELDENGMAKVKLGEEEFYIDATGERRDYTPPPNEPVNTSGSNETNYSYTVFSENDKDGLKDAEGNIVIEAVYDHIYNTTEDRNYVIILNDDKFGFYNIKSKTLIEPEYDDCFGFFENGLALVHRDDKWYFMDIDENTVSDLVFEDARHCNSTIMAVKLNGKWGYADSDGKYIAEPAFEEVESFADNGIAAVKLNGKWGFIDMRGKMIIEPKFEKVESFGNFDLAPACVNGKFGYIDLSGEFVIKPQFTYAYSFDDRGYANVYDRVPYEGIGNEGALIDKSGKLLCSYDYDMFSYFSDGYIICYRDGGSEFSLITAAGKEITSSKDFDAILEFFRYNF